MDLRGSNQLHQLLETGRLYSVSEGQVFQSSDARYRSLVNLIKNGYVKRYEISNDGSLAVQAIYGPDDVFPLTILFKTLLDLDVYEGPEIIYYEPLTDAEIYSLDSSIVLENVEKDAVLYKDILLEAAIRTHSNIQRLENLSLHNSYRRTAHQLLYYAKQFGTKTPQGINLKLVLTHQDMADVLSLTRETVSRNMHKLHEQGLIKMDRQINIPDLEKLERVAYG